MPPFVSHPSLDTRRGVLRAAGIVAASAAVAGTLGDFLLLAVANAGRQGVAVLAEPSPAALLAGHYLGVLAIPLYGAGYWLVTQGFAPEARRPARIVLALGVIGSVLGGTIHGLTGMTLHFEQLSHATGDDPFTVLARHGAYLLPLWGLLAAILCCGSAVYARAVWSGKTTYPRWMALANPALLVIALSLLSVATEPLQAFLLPAAPNVAHVLFFAVTIAQLWDGSSGGRGEDAPTLR